MKKVSWEKKYPDWQVRKIRLLQKVFVSREFSEDTEQLRERLGYKANTSSAASYWLMDKYQLPYGCLEAIEAYIAGKKLDSDNPQEWAHYIKAEPITYINLDKNILGPKNNSLGAYLKLLELLEGKEDSLKYLIEDKTLLILPTNTTRQELNTFLDAHFKEINEVLSNPEGKLLLQKRITRPSKQAKKLMKLRDEGKSYPEILKQLNLDGKQDITDLSRKYRTQKKRLNTDK